MKGKTAFIFPQDHSKVEILLIALFQLKFWIVIPAQAGIQRFDKLNLLHRIYLNAM